MNVHIIIVNINFEKDNLMEVTKDNYYVDDDFDYEFDVKNTEEKPEMGVSVTSEVKEKDSDISNNETDTDKSNVKFNQFFE